MPYCPQCHAEYEEGVKLCGTCQIPLVLGSAPERSQSRGEPKVKLVRLRKFTGPTARLDAELAKNLLDSEGIPCVLPGEISAETIPIFDIPLLVREEDVDRATETLASYLDTSGPDPFQE